MPQTTQPALGLSKGEFFTFKDLTRTDLATMAGKGTRDYARHVLDRVFNVEAEEGFRKEILSDFHLNNYLFCLESGFSDRKQSALCSLMAHLFRQTVRTRLDIHAAFDLFKALLLRHSVQRPPWSVGVFSTQDVKDVTNYVLDTFFRHFKLFQYVYVTREEVRVVPARSLMPAMPPAVAFEEKDVVTDEAQEEAIKALLKGMVDEVARSV